MSDPFASVENLFASAAVKRKRGDALRRKDREDAAVDAYGEAVELYQAGLEQLDGFEAETSTDEIKIAALRAEGLGSKGGVHVRLDQYDTAVEHYEKGSALEEQVQMASTYNRVNFVKNSLQADKKRVRLDELQDRIKGIAKVLEEQLRVDTKLSDQGWAWADLGDCLALIGDVQGAANAYQTFIDKAPTRAPESTLRVLRGVAAAVRETDPETAAKIEGSLEYLSDHLHGPTAT